MTTFKYCLINLTDATECNPTHEELLQVLVFFLLDPKPQSLLKALETQAELDATSEYRLDPTTLLVIEHKAAQS